MYTVVVFAVFQKVSEVYASVIKAIHLHIVIQSSFGTSYE